MLVALVALASAGQSSPLQIWEKPIAPDLVYREEIDSGAPRMVHILRFSPGGGTKLSAELPGGVIYKIDANKGRATVSDLMRRTGAVAGINGDFFPFTGDPLGLMVHRGQLLSAPYVVHSSPFVSRPALAWTEGQFKFATSIHFLGDAKIADGPSFHFDGLNQECGQNQICVETPTAAFAQAKAPNIHLVVKISKLNPTLAGEGVGEVRAVFRDQTNVPVPEGYIVLTATGNKVPLLERAASGSQVVIHWSVSGLNMAPDEAIGGGPMLVRNGHLAVDAKEEGFDPGFTEKHHPRTAIGRRADGELWFVVVDGRQKMSDGMSLPQLAQWFLDHGCVDAMNLDGGGSSAMNLFGALVNRPSDGSERPVANALVFYSPLPAASADGLSISNPGQAEGEIESHLKVITATGAFIPNAEIVWSCRGAAWIDQGGTLHPLAKGDSKVTAWCRGAMLTRTITTR